MIDILKKKIESEIEILREFSIFAKKMKSASPYERTLLKESIDSLAAKMRTINDEIPELLNRTGNTKSEPEIRKKISETKAKDRGTKASIATEDDDKEQMLRELEISERALKKIRKRKLEKEEEPEEFKSARGYLKLSNRFFLKTADKLIKKDYFSNLPSELRKSNLDMLFEGYVAMMLFSTLLAFIVGIVAAAVLIIIEMSWITRVIWLPLILPIGVFLILYYYPTAEKKSIAKRINEEIPFAAIHMSSIAGSGIEPTEIFKIIALSREYPFMRKEIRKILNQINIYGYDLVTALNNVSKSTPNEKLAELFTGLATTINSGGSMTEFFQKRAETLLLDYKLEKEKAIKIAETSMDIYISVVIAAPMILMLMLVMISVSGIQIGFSPYELTFMTIAGVALINIIFLAYLQTKRTLY